MSRGKPPLNQTLIVSSVDGPEELRKAVVNYAEKTGMSKKSIARWALTLWAKEMGYGNIIVPLTTYEQPITKKTFADCSTLIEEAYSNN